VTAARQFAQGEKVKVAKKSRVVDKEREHENVEPSTLPEIDQDVTGLTGEVYGESYYSDKRGETLHPIMLPNGAVIAVPEKRLERADKSVRRNDGGGQSGLSGVSAATLEYWRKRFLAMDRKEGRRRK
jgi:hypothetical protein